MDKIQRLCKTRGFIFATAEVHGGFSSSYDYGPLGALLKRNLENSWWRRFVTRQPQVFALDSAILLPKRVFEASGHLSGFSDPLVDCKRCGKRFRADHILPETGSVEDMQTKLRAGGCPCKKIKEGWGNEVSNIRDFNLMFSTSVGPVVDEGSSAYFRPETAQGAFMNFNNISTTCARDKLPFGIAQIGKAFRNEVTPGNFIFRTREFEQMELQWFCSQDEERKWFDFWISESLDWLVEEVGVKKESIRLEEHSEDDLAHYSKHATDVEFKFPFGWGELWGFANRGVYDLSQHGLGLNVQGKDGKPEKMVPTVIEPSLGLTRLVLAVLCDAYDEELVENKEGRPESRTVLRLAPGIAPISVAIMPLIVKNAQQVEITQAIYKKITDNPYLGHSPMIDLSGASVGKRYRRFDEIGTPFCVTVDFDTIEDGTVTVRERDSMKQVRLSIDEVASLNIHELANHFR